MWGVETLGLKRFVREPKRHYLSAVSVEFDKGSESFFKQYEQLANTVHRYMKNETGMEYPVHLKRMDFGFDPDEIAGIRPANFMLERRVGVPYVQNRFFSEAPIRTDTHLELLQEIESLLV